FGQFCGAQALVRSAGVMVGGLLAGVYLDLVKGHFAPGDLKAYRFIYLWIGFFAIVAYVFHYRAYRYWKRLGGDDGTAPTAYFKYSDLPKAKHSGVDKKLLLVPISAFSGFLGGSLFFMYYFQFIMPNPHNVVVFGILTALLVGFFFGYLRFVRFMERP
ncbi:MAG: hypothetical protein NTW91_06910, partial [Verrucomicrobia bacterium]|nr:hypothetical protein [Verrucomicrobiota bacterium]